ncbi:MAG TPA: plasmid mobilization relaxosome protein MobC [Bryobacteraceae bacterium]
MGRPAKSEKRCAQFNLKLTLREIAFVRARAARAGMAAFEYGRTQLLAGRNIPKCEATPAHLDPLFIAQVKRIGANLNQIARRLHQWQLPAPGELEAALREIREMIGKAARHGA